MVQGFPRGSFHLLAPEATKSCGTFLPFRYFCTAVFGPVPSCWKVKSTSSCSTSLRVISTVFDGLYASSALIRLSLRPLTPPWSLIFLK